MLGRLTHLRYCHITQADATGEHHVEKSAGNRAAGLDGVGVGRRGLRYYLKSDGVFDGWEKYRAQKLPIVYNLNKDVLRRRLWIAATASAERAKLASVTSSN